MQKIKAAGGVVYRKEGGKTEVLLIHRNGVWDLPKGKAEEGEEMIECAVREVAEETGLNRLPRAEASLGTTIHYYKERGGLIEKETHWWSMRLEAEQETFVPQTEEGVTRVSWCEIGEAKRIAGYENLKEVLNKFTAEK